ncbi:Alpha/Beta hydrolase protein [Thamnidium elegans]|nr:Alpha/Beta hydrolase protein [Thamnidium elegans]
MVSKRAIPVIGLSLTVYGLQEYLALDKGTPVSVMFALHGRLQNQSKMEPMAEALCKLNQHRKHDENYLLVITFDCPNHGTRLVHKLANFAWAEGKYQNPNHALDMWAMVNSTASTVSELIDVVEHYLFGGLERSIVKVWGVLGFSMGGHAAFLAAANDPRITVAIPIVGISDFLSLMQSRLEESKLPASIYLPQPFQNLIAEKMSHLDEKLKFTHLLMLNGEKDDLVKSKYNAPLVQNLRKIHVGKEGYDWKFYLIPGVGHEWCPQMIESSVEWTYQWMVKNNEVSKL